jgi:hypothetical protein
MASKPLKRVSFVVELGAARAALLLIYLRSRMVSRRLAKQVDDCEHRFNPGDP